MTWNKKYYQGNNSNEYSQSKYRTTINQQSVFSQHNKPHQYLNKYHPYKHSSNKYNSHKSHTHEYYNNGSYTHKHHKKTSKVNSYRSDLKTNQSELVNMIDPKNKEDTWVTYPQENNPSRYEAFRVNHIRPDEGASNMKAVNRYTDKHRNSLVFILNLFNELQNKQTFYSYETYLFGSQIVLSKIGSDSKDIDIRIFTIGDENSEIKQINEITKMINDKINNKQDGVNTLSIFQRNKRIEGTAIIIDFLDGKTKLDITLYPNCKKKLSDIFFKFPQSINWNVIVGILKVGKKGMKLQYINYHGSIESFLRKKGNKFLRLKSSLEVMHTNDFYMNMAFIIKTILFKLLPNIANKSAQELGYSTKDFKTAWYELFYLNIKSNPNNKQLNRSFSYLNNSLCRIFIDESIFILFEKLVKKKFLIIAVFYLIMQNFSYIKESEDIIQKLFLSAIINSSITNVATKNYSIAEYLQQNNISDKQLSGMLVIMLLCCKNSICSEQFRKKIVPIVPNISPQEILNYSDMYYYTLKKDDTTLTNLINTFPNYIKIHCYLLQSFINQNQPNPKTNHINNKAMIQCNSTLFAVNNNVNKPKLPINWEVKEDNQEAKQSQATDHESTGSQTITTI